MNETNQETWNATHAQLLKSVADAQAKLLAAQNEITDKLDKLSEYSTHNLEVAEKRINGRLDGFRLRLDSITELLTQPRREKLLRIIKRTAPQRKQRR